ncbi:MAG: MFS transporter [Pseudomonadota bacterium]
MSPRGAEVRFAALYSGLFLALGAQVAFGPVWLAEWGLSEGEIGTLLTVAICVRIGAGLALPILSDRWGRPRRMIFVLGLICALAFAGHLAVGDRLSLGVLVLITASTFAGLIPLADAHGYASAERVGFSYRRARSVGSFAFLIATVAVGGLMERWGADAMIWWATAAALVVALAGLKAPAAEHSPDQRPRWREGFMLLSNRRFVTFLAAVSLINASHAVYYTYSSVHWSSLGYSETLIGVLWAWGVVAEIVLFWVGRSLMERLGAVGALVLAAAAGVLRWSVLAYDPHLPLLFGVQTLHAFTFGVMHLAVMAFVANSAPPRLVGTAQGMVSSIGGGVGMALATQAAAQLYPSAGALTYFSSAAIALAGCALALTLARQRMV